MKASLSTDRAILAVFRIILSRTQVVSTKIVSGGVVTHKEVLFWEGTIATVDEIANRSGFDAIDFICCDIMNRRGIITEKCSFVKSPSVPRERESF
jgi:hypothetical protein